MLAEGNALVDKEEKMEKDYEELDDYKKALDDAWKEINLAKEWFQVHNQRAVA